MGKGANGWVPANCRDPKTLADNAPAVTSAFPATPSGYLGKPSGHGRVRVIASDDPLGTAELLASLASTGATHEMELEHGTAWRLLDGTVVSYRWVSSSDGTPAVELNVTGSGGSLRSQKIHFTYDD